MVDEDDVPEGQFDELARTMVRTGRAMREALDRNAGLNNEVTAATIELRGLRSEVHQLGRVVRGDGNGDKGIAARIVRLETLLDRIVNDQALQDDRRFKVGLLIGGTFLTALAGLGVALFKP